MKKISIIILFIYIFINTVNSQTNANPDPNGDPWIVGGIPEMTPEMQALIDSLPILQLTEESLVTNNLFHKKIVPLKKHLKNCNYN